MGQVFNFIFGIRRAQIGTISVDASMRESHEARSEVTKYPIEEGADQTDHVRLLPLSFSMDGVISDSPIGYVGINAVTGMVETTMSLFGNSSRSKDAYEALMELRDTREPFDVVTGLRVYSNMILEDFVVNRTARTGQAMHFRARLIQIEVARTVRVAAPMSSDVADIGGNKVDLGKKVSSAVPESSPIAAGSGVVTSATQLIIGASSAFSIYSALG